MNLDRYKSLALRRDGRVLHVAFNRPDSLNAFDAALHDEFERLLHELPYDDAIARRRAHRQRQGVLGRRRHRRPCSAWWTSPTA